MAPVLTEGPAESRRPRNRKGAASRCAEPPLLSIVVPNWQGEQWLGRCLSALQVSARAAGHPFELIVVDDASSDSSVAVIRERFPRVRLFVNKRNAGFARSVNRGIRAARGRVLVLANNDIVCAQDFIGRLTEWFPDSGRGGGAPLFAVSARTVSWYDGRPNQLCMGAVWQGGRITPAWSDPADPSPCLFAQAGAAAYDIQLVRTLGGLSTLFEPGYWEDYDLSWRAARRGWRQIYDPHAFALHAGGGSMTKRFGAARVAAMKGRNHLLFELAHLRSPQLLAQWSARIPLRLARDCADGSWRQPHSFSRAMQEALPRLREALAMRLSEPAGVSDLSLLAPWASFKPSY